MVRRRHIQERLSVTDRGDLLARTYHHHIGNTGVGRAYSNPVADGVGLTEFLSCVSSAAQTRTDSLGITDPAQPVATIISGPSLVASDAFNRGTQASLGTADTGGVWAAVAGTWRIVSDQAALTAQNIANEAVAMLPVSAALASGLIMVDVQLSAANSHVGLVFRGTDVNSYAAVQLQKTTGGTDQLRISKRVAGVSTYWVTTTPMGLVAGRGYTLAVLLTSTGVVAYVDGVSAGSYSFAGQDITDLPGNRLGLRSWDYASADEDGGSRWDDLAANSGVAVLTPRIPAPPIAPSAAATGPTAATVSWTQAGNGSSPLTSYTVRSSAGNTFTGISPAVTSFNATGLTTNLAQTFTVTAINAVGSRVSVASNSVTPTTTTVPQPPTNVIATANDAQATVTWSAPSNNGGSPIIDYTVTSSGTPAHTATTTLTSVVVTGLTNGTSYTFTVTARNAIGSSAPSSPSAAVTPQAGTGTITHGSDIRANPSLVGLRVATTRTRGRYTFSDAASISAFGSNLTGSGTQADPYTIDRVQFTGDVFFSGAAIHNMWFKMTNCEVVVDGTTGSTVDGSAQVKTDFSGGVGDASPACLIIEDSTLHCSGPLASTGGPLNGGVQYGVAANCPLRVTRCDISGANLPYYIQNLQPVQSWCRESWVHDVWGIAVIDHTDVINGNAQANYVEISRCWLNGIRGPGSQIAPNNIAIYDDSPPTPVTDWTIDSNYLENSGIAIISTTVPSRFLDPFVVINNIFNTSAGGFSCRPPSTQYGNVNQNGTPVTV